MVEYVFRKEDIIQSFFDAWEDAHYGLDRTWGMRKNLIKKHNSIDNNKQVINEDILPKDDAPQV